MFNNKQYVLYILIYFYLFYEQITQEEKINIIIYKIYF